MTALPVITCEGCGACCRHLGTPPGYALFFPAQGLTPSWAWESSDGVRFGALPEEVRGELARYYAAVRAGRVADRTRGEDTPCLWYDEQARRCKHHAYRPDTCREFAVGGEDCLRLRREVLEA